MLRDEEGRVGADFVEPEIGGAIGGVHTEVIGSAVSAADFSFALAFCFDLYVMEDGKVAGHSEVKGGGGRGEWWPDLLDVGQSDFISTAPHTRCNGVSIIVGYKSCGTLAENVDVDDQFTVGPDPAVIGFAISAIDGQ